MDSTSDDTDLELTLSFKPLSSYVPKSLNNLLTDLALVDSAAAKLSELETYLQKHEKELRRIQAFCGDHDLPHCKLLLKSEIEAINENISIIKNGNIEADHHTAPLIWKRRNQPENPSFRPSKRILMARPNKWSRKGKLENTGTDPMPNFNINVGVSTIPLVNDHPSPMAIEISRNGRRVWTPELHSRFMKTLNDLGGPEAATPKQIRDRMRVKGLTSDQVKSHLQKYRIYKRAGLPIPQAGAGSSSAVSAENLHQPAMTSQENWTIQSPVPYTRDFFGTASSPAQEMSKMTRADVGMETR